MQTFLTLPHEHEAPLPAWANADADLRLPRSLTDRVLSACSAPGDVVLDPFAGFGTTLVAAEDLGRNGYGVESDPRRAEYTKDRLTHPDRLVAGDAFAVDLGRVPAVDLLFTSPPYTLEGLDADPFAGYAEGSDYDAYLENLGALFERLNGTLAPGATVVVEASNLKFLGEVTTLAWDVADALGQVFDFRGEIVVGWEGAGDGRSGDDGDWVGGSDDGEEGDDGTSGDRTEDDANGTYAYGYDHSFCLVFDADE